MELDTHLNEYFFYSWLIPLAYVTYMILMCLYSKKLQEKPLRSLYHKCSKKNAKKIYKDYYFFARTEGIVFCTSNCKSNGLGEDAVNLRKVDLYIKLLKSYKNKKKLRTPASLEIYKIKTKGIFKKLFRIKDMFTNYTNLMPVVFTGRAIDLFQPVFPANRFFLFKFWHSLKMFTKQWTTKRQGNIIIKSARISNGKLFITDADIETKKGFAFKVAIMLKAGMIALNLLFFFIPFSVPFCLLFNLNSDCIFWSFLAVAITFSITIVFWMAVSKKVHRRAEK